MSIFSGICNIAIFRYRDFCALQFIQLNRRIGTGFLDWFNDAIILECKLSFQFIFRIFAISPVVLFLSPAHTIIISGISYNLNMTIITPNMRMRFFFKAAGDRQLFIFRIVFQLPGHIEAFTINIIGKIISKIRIASMIPLNHVHVAIHKILNDCCIQSGKCRRCIPAIKVKYTYGLQCR